MSSEPEKATSTAEPKLGVLAATQDRRTSGGARKQPPGDRTEAQLRARVSELEAQLVEVARCLEAAESRAAELVAARAQVTLLEAELETLEAELDGARRDAEHRLAVIKATRSWRFTAPLRMSMGRVRERLGR